MRTMIQLNEPERRLDRAIQERLRDAGYGIQQVKNDVGQHYVFSDIQKIISEQGEESLFSLTIGNVTAERRYRISPLSVAPTTRMTITGAAPFPIRLNDDVFGATSEGTHPDVFNHVVFRGSSTDAEIDRSTTGSKVVADSESGVQPFSQVVKENMYETMRSNFEDLFDQFDDIEKTVLVFPNDSLYLGAANKRIIKQYVERMNQETDVMSVIGCSHGKTALTNGNSRLAIGRANRVKEDLVAHGVSYGKVLDEGCWAPRHFDEMMPRRGVVLTLKRKKA